MASALLSQPHVADVGTAAGDAFAAPPTLEEAPLEELQELESLCMRCGDNGTTRLLLTRIPHFREIVLMAFECPHCHERNSEVQFAGRLEPRGVTLTLRVPENDREALNRQVVKADHATVRIPELEFEIPEQAQRGTLTTVEGLLTRAAEDLRALQAERRDADPTMAAALDTFLGQLDAAAEGRRAFTVVLDDPTGNSFIENPHAPRPDPQLTQHYYTRSVEQNVQIGAMAEEALPDRGPAPGSGPEADGTAGERTGGGGAAAGAYVPAGTRYVPGMAPHGAVGATRMQAAIAEGSSEAVAQALFKYAAPEEVMVFPATCGACGAACETRMYVTTIPYFKEVIVMASTCDTCGYKNSELKPGGAIPARGRRSTLQVTCAADLSRDVIKSDSAAVAVPEAELELAPGTLGGKVTTVEGLLTAISEKLASLHSFSLGDSAQQVQRSAWQTFEARLRGLLALERPWTLILEDPLANSFIAPATDDPANDPQLVHEEFERSAEQDEELGLTQMDTRAADVAYAAQDQQAAATDGTAEARTQRHVSNEPSRPEG
ncbi:hypothetical protein KFL_006060030 [Klebsormidium nitens]|uniref:Zinc finger ZPR1-type domain-containing protein n=1 Tax=Klebsormidium nitens TaxID=105231 RepID=A0A1Y1IL35_KLENI|nr:hypothetical protein KFL_006060030 [Klebsormidium nitens]|eukprot:GAQ90149.1 hypothetical protein KFL_006060030 [Klebsormidium nitens]